jgi:predicted nucleotidyltransferase
MNQSSDKVIIPKERKEAFEILWNKQLLGAYETVSGMSSTRLHTHNLRNGLQSLIDSGLFSSIVDVGCGDWNWMSCVNLKEISYTGIDIVKECVDRNQQLYGRPHCNFLLMDIVTNIPPRADIILCRHVLSHLSNHDIILALNNIKKSGSDYLAFTNQDILYSKPKNYPQLKEMLNRDISAGYWRPVNLLEKPFYFPAPILSIPENQGGKEMMIWKISDIPELTIDQLTSPPDFEKVTEIDVEKSRFISELSKLDFVIKIGMYGSRTSFYYQPDSDIDIMLYCTHTPTREEWQLICDIIDRRDIPLEVDCKVQCDELASVFDRPDDYDLMRLNMIMLYQKKSSHA